MQTSGQPGQPKVKGKVMTQNGQEKVPAVPEAKAADYERGLAMLLTVTHERDEALKEVFKRDQQIAINKIEMEGLRAQMEETRSRIQSYQNERDVAMSSEAKANARLEAIADVVLSQIRSRSIEIADNQTDEG